MECGNPLPLFGRAVLVSKRLIPSPWTSSMIVVARPRFMSADFAHRSKSSNEKPSCFPFTDIWCGAVHEPVGL
jgi:hypothetical protein